MSKKAFDKIADGLGEVLAIARGDAEPAKLHIPAAIDVIPSSASFHPSSRTERCEPQASSAPIRDLGDLTYDSLDEVPDSLACGSASGMTGEGLGSLV